MTPLELLIQRMQDKASEALMSGGTADPVLVHLLEAAAVSLTENRPVFPNPMEEPVLWRHFMAAVRQAILGVERYEELANKLLGTGKG